MVMVTISSFNAIEEQASRGQGLEESFLFYLHFECALSRYESSKRCYSAKLCRASLLRG